MAHATIAANFNQAFDVHLHFSAQIAFNLEILGDIFTQGSNFGLSQILNPGIRANLSRFQDLVRTSGPIPKM